MPATPNYRGICNQRLHWSALLLEQLERNQDRALDGALRDGAMLQLQIAYAAHIADLMNIRDTPWRGQSRADTVRLESPELDELKALEQRAAWLTPLLDMAPTAVVAALARGADNALLASSTADYKTIDNNTISELHAKLDEVIQRQRDQLQEY